LVLFTFCIQGCNVDSQEKATPPANLVPCTPATSTPKPLFTEKQPVRNQVSTDLRQPLKFITNAQAVKSKASTAINTVLVSNEKAKPGKNSKENKSRLPVKKQELQRPKATTKKTLGTVLPHTTPVGQRNIAANRKRLNGVTGFGNLEDSDSPALDYEPSTALRKRLHPKTSSNRDPDKQNMVVVDTNTLIVSNTKSKENSKQKPLNQSVNPYDFTSPALVSD